MCRLESRGVICAVTSHSNHFIVGLKSLHKPLFIHRSCTSYYLQIADPLAKLIIGQSGKLRACDNIAVCVILIPKPYLTTYLSGCGRSVTGDNLDINPRCQNLVHRLRDIRTHRICNGNNAKKMQRITKR